jgi:uncharacterized DUF497 family protein
MGLIDRYNGFDLDDCNRSKNLRKHGVTDEEIEQAYTNDPYLERKDVTHSEDEERWIALAKTDGGDPLFLVHTIMSEQDQTYIRPKNG